MPQHTPSSGSDSAVAFVQPFSVGAAGGGARILRALIAGVSRRMISICTTPECPPECRHLAEFHVPIRPSWGRMERTRFHEPLGVTELLFARRIQASILKLLAQEQVSVVHVIPHYSLDFHHAFCAAKKLHCRTIVSVHDHPLYTFATAWNRATCLKAFRTVWREADECFVISVEMGEDLQARFGPRRYQLISDGVDSPQRGTEYKAPRRPGTIYFMGLFHWSYSPNLQALLKALASMRGQGDCGPRFLARSVITETHHQGIYPVEIRGFGSELDVSRDIAEADLLYLPMSYSKDYEYFRKFSLSTKMITYLAAGRAIIYHGPGDAAAAGLLARHKAAYRIDSLDPGAIREQLTGILEDKKGEQLVQNATKLVRQHYDIAAIKARFWAAFESPPAEIHAQVDCHS